MDQQPISHAHLARLEALLFIHGEPVTFKKIGQVLNINPEETEALVHEFQRRLEGDDRGLALVASQEKIQLVTKGEFSDIVQSFVKSELSEELSPASLETLAIIAYFGPISRARIDYQRGVNSSFILRSLLLRGLIERSADPAHQSSYLYAPTLDVLKYLGLSKQADLPNFETFSSLLRTFEGGEEAPKVPAPSEGTS